MLIFIKTSINEVIYNKKKHGLKLDLKNNFKKSFPPKQGNKATKTEGVTECEKIWENKTLLRRQYNKRTGIKKAEDNDCHRI